MNAYGYFKELEEQAPAKIEAIRFELTSECGPASAVTTWKQADDILRQWSKTAPDNLCYDKCHFVVTWADGQAYSGRYDLKRHDGGFTDLLAYHIRRHLEFLAGTRKPDHLTPAQYAEYLSTTDTAACQKFLDAYEIGNAESANAPTLEVVHDPQPEPQRPTYIKTDPSKLPAGKAPIQLRNIRNAWESDTYNADIWPGQAIRLFGAYKNLVNGPAEFDITFTIGDQAEYGSYNLIYTGEIVSIGAKTVTIKKRGYKQNTRLDIGSFANKNWDFDAERIAQYNHQESYYI